MDYIQLSDGTKIDKATGEVLGAETSIPEDGEEEPGTELINIETSEIKDHLRSTKHISDLPGDINSSRVIGLISSLTLYGLSDIEISTVCGTELSAIQRVKDTEGYKQFFTTLIENVMDAHADSVRHMFVRASKDAATTIIAGMQSNNPDLRHAASKDVLDRAGMRPADIIEHRVRFEDELRIVHVRSDNEMPVLELDHEEN